MRGGHRGARDAVGGLEKGAIRRLLRVNELGVLTVSEPIQEEMTLEPGAQMSTRAPKFEYEALASAMVEAPTVTAEGARAGEKPETLALELPAATMA